MLECDCNITMASAANCTLNSHANIESETVKWAAGLIQTSAKFINDEIHIYQHHRFNCSHWWYDSWPNITNTRWTVDISTVSTMTILSLVEMIFELLFMRFGLHNLLLQQIKITHQRSSRGRSQASDKLNFPPLKFNCYSPIVVSRESRRGETEWSCDICMGCESSRILPLPRQQIQTAID